jgi:PhnB protein
MQMNTYLTFDGRCEEAFSFYARVLGGSIESMFRNGDTPVADQVPADWRDKIMHATLNLPGGVLMGSDSQPGSVPVEPAGFAISLHPKEPADAERIFAALSEGGTVQMPIQQTFWSVRFGMLTDRFGIPWMVNCEQAPQAA